MKSILTCLCLLFSSSSYASLTCEALLVRSRASFSYVDKGSTGVVFEKKGRMYKVIFNPFASNYDVADGLQAALHEAHLLKTFHDILAASRLTQFKPMNLVFAEKLKNKELIAATSQIMRGRGFKKDISVEMNGVLVTEKIVGRTLHDIIEDPSVSVDDKFELVDRFNGELLNIERYLKGNQSEFKLTSSKNRVTYDWLNDIDLGDGNFINIHQLAISLVPAPGAQNSDAVIYLGAPTNVMVQADGSFVLIDPN